MSAATTARAIAHPQDRLQRWLIALLLLVLGSLAAAHGAAVADAPLPGIVQITGADQLTKLITNATTPLLLDFSAVWCGPCKALKKEFPALLTANAGKLVILEVDVDQLPDVASSYQVTAMPTLVLIRKGKPQETKLGAMSAQQLAAWIGLAAPPAADAPAAPAATPTPTPTPTPAAHPDHSSLEQPAPAVLNNDTTKLVLSDEQWKQRLSPELYTVSRRKGTEPAFCGGYTAIEQNGAGLYRCAACGAPLFISDTKFDSGSGWPSFFKAIPGRVDQSTDTSYGMERTEVHCARCGGHLGHLFNDGPAPSGLRYCINAITLTFQPKATAEAAAAAAGLAAPGKQP